MNVTFLNCHRVASITIGDTRFLNTYNGEKTYTTDVIIVGVDGNEFRLTAFSSETQPLKVNVPEQKAERMNVLETLEDLCTIRC